MSQLDKYRKGWVITLFFFFVSCSTPCHQWYLEETITSCPCYNSAILVLPVQNKFKELEIEIVRGPYDTKMYLNAFSLPFPLDSEDPDKTQILLAIDGKTETIVADRLLGGQRLWIPTDVSEQIISALLNDQVVHIGIGRYQTDIIQENFNCLYSDLNKVPM